MFRKPRVNQPPSTVLGHSPSSSSTSSPPVDLTSSPPSAKKQKTTHPAPTITLPTPSRPRAPRQTQLTPFVSTPTTSKKTTPIKSTGKKKAKNTSILKFFKPLTKEEAANGRRRKEDGYSDSLFIAHGGYGLDVSDPEDGDDNDDADEDVRIALWGRPGVEVEDAAEPPSNDAMEELELVGEIVQTDEIIADYAPGTADTVETSTPSTPPKPKLEAPKFNPSTLKLNISASMLFGKVPPTPSVTEEDSTVSTSDSITRDDPKTELAKCGNGKDSLKRGLLWRRDAMGEGEALDEIEDPTQTQRNKKRPFFQPELKDEIQSTFEQMNVNPEDGAKDGDQDLSSCNDDVEDSGDDEIGFEEREAYFGFDPAARAIEGGFEDWGGDMEIVMKPPDCDDIEATPTEDVAAPLCPVCETKLVGLSEADANNHVNHCLDGNPIPLPKLEPNVTAITFTKPPTSRTSNPHSALQMSGKSQGHSAFAKLMSTNTEAHAWAAAAKAEVDSKGVKAAERTCPFYKILFNGPISVDAFRYGAVPSCNAYFLSHFHSDHYVGLASKWDHGPIYCSRVTANLVRTRLKVDPIWVHELPWEEWFEVPNTNGVRVQGLDANHCPGSMLFLFEKEVKGKRTRILHCGDFRADPKHLSHPLLKPGKDRKQKLDTVYLDTTYLDPKYAFPSQKSVIDACAEMCVALHQEKPLGIKKEHGRLGGFMTKSPEFKKEPGVGTSKGRLLVVVGTYSIGKERICTGIAHALNSKIYATPQKLFTLRLLEDPALSHLLTTNPNSAQVHLTHLGGIGPDTLSTYLSSHPGFSRVVAFRPSGWSYKPPNSRLTTTPKIEDVLYSSAWRSGYGVAEMQPMRGSNEKLKMFAVPYSEHSSFRELSMFCCAVEIGKIVPTVNVGSKKSREKMNKWIEKWEQVRRKGGFRLVEEGGEGVW